MPSLARVPAADSRPRLLALARPLLIALGGALLQEGIDVAVILNALPALTD